MSLHVKKGDTVAVIAGKDKKKTGKVLAVNPSEGTVIVDGVNIITKHNKPRSANQPGGIVKENGKIDADEYEGWKASLWRLSAFRDQRNRIRTVDQAASAARACVS